MPFEPNKTLEARENRRPECDAWVPTEVNSPFCRCLLRFADSAFVALLLRVGTDGSSREIEMSLEAHGPPRGCALDGHWDTID